MTDFYAAYTALRKRIVTEVNTAGTVTKTRLRKVLADFPAYPPPPVVVTPPPAPQTPVEPPPVVSVPTSTPHLPHDMPLRAVLRAADNDADAHAFPAYGPELELAYYRTKFLPPGGVEGAGTSWEADHRLTGGYMRDAPHASIRLTTDSIAVRYRKMIDAAKAAGLDGVHCDLLSNSTVTNGLWQRALNWQDACRAAGDFDFTPMVDATASFGKAGPVAIADHLAIMFSRPSGAAVKRVDGKLCYSVFSPESAGADGAAQRAHWDAVNERLRTVHGFDCWQINCYVSQAGLTSAGGAPNYATADYVLWNGRWGVANPVAAAAAHREPIDFPAKFGRGWMHYTGPADQRYTRTTGLKYEESDHTGLLRASMRVAIEGKARALQPRTYDDHREHSALGPSLLGGYAWLDLLSVYLAWYKLGVRQPTRRDTSFLSWRPHRHDVTTGFGSPTFDPANLMPRVGSTPAVATVENLTFLTAPAEVFIDVAGVITKTPVTHAQIDASWDGAVSVKAPHHVGAHGGLSTWVVRNGVEVPGTRVTVPAAEGVTSSPLVQDLAYRLRTSRESLRPAIT